MLLSSNLIDDLFQERDLKRIFQPEEMDMMKSLGKNLAAKFKINKLAHDIKSAQVGGNNLIGSAMQDIEKLKLAKKNEKKQKQPVSPFSYLVQKSQQRADDSKPAEGRASPFSQQQESTLP